MEWLTVISLILIGIVLIIVEIIFIPGTTVVGIIGGILTVVGIIFAFSYFGDTTGWIITGSTAVLSGGAFYWSLRSGAWDRFSLKSTIDSRVNVIDTETLKVGEEGKAISAL